jgi:fatty acyl-CoA reductase
LAGSHVVFLIFFEMQRWMDDETLNLATQKLLGKKPNTFTYTKFVAETLLQQEAAGLPLVIVRPSTIGASWKDPFAGWVEKSSELCDLFIAVCCTWR